MTDFPVDPLELDTDAPCNESYFVDRANDMFHQHGGVTTRIVFDSVEELPISRLRAELDNPITEDQLMTVRSAKGAYMLMLRGDKVIRYKGCTFEDCLTGEMVKLLTANTNMTYTPMSTYPLIHVNINNNGKLVTVRIPKRKILFQGDHSLGNIEDEVTLPTLWFATKMNLANSQLGAYVAIEDHLDTDPKKCTLKQLCFPNTYPTGNICFGQTKTTTKVDVMTESMVVNATISRMFNSMFNNHVLWDYKDFLRSVKTVYDELPELPQYKKAIASRANSSDDAGFLRYLRILHEPDGYLRVDQPKVSQNDVLNNFLQGAL